jgi:hypothetical protein
VAGTALVFTCRIQQLLIAKSMIAKGRSLQSFILPPILRHRSHTPGRPLWCHRGHAPVHPLGVLLGACTLLLLENDLTVQYHL